MEGKTSSEIITSQHDMQTENVKLVCEPTIFFKEELNKAFSKQNLKHNSDIEFYLVDLLTRFMFTDNFFKNAENGEKKNETLALLYQEALTAPDHGKRREDLKRLGDISLYTAGFFSESLMKKAVDVDYYISMGSAAYANLSQIVIDTYFRKVYSELADRFVKFVDVLSEMSALAIMNDPKNILRHYELWLKTGSERAEKNLKEAGIIPNDKIKTNIQ